MFRNHDGHARPWIRSALLIGLALLGKDADAQTLPLIFSFTGGTAGAAAPVGTPVLSGSALYDMSQVGGTYNTGANGGTIYTVNTDGSGFRILHSFGGANDHGAAGIVGSLDLQGSVLYGTTYGGGQLNNGSIFSINSDGSNYQTLYYFPSGGNLGYGPYGDLVVNGSTMYGTTSGGGTAFDGTIYTMQTNGTGYATLYSFSGATTDGRLPKYGALALSGTTLYGTTQDGGADNYGSVYSVGTNGSGFTLLHSFTGGATDGTYPQGGLFEIGSTLYGTTSSGGTGGGTIFSINSDGSNFKLHDS